MPKRLIPKDDAERDWDERAKLLRVMAHPTRLAILERLCAGPCCVTEVNQRIDLPQPQLSQHIAALRKAELIACHTNGPLRCYYVIKPTLVKPLIRLLCQDHPVRERERATVVREAQKVQLD
jgi:ArsR family transcriptional regulator